MAEGKASRLGSVRKEDDGLLGFLFVWGEKVSKRDGHIMEVMREKRKEVKGRWGKEIGKVRVLI